MNNKSGINNKVLNFRGICSVFFIVLLFPFSAFTQQSVNQYDLKGLRQGIWQKNHPNGNIMYRGTFKDDKPVGEWKRYHENGGLKAILQYSETSDSVRAKLFENSLLPVAAGIFLGEKKAGTWNYYSGEKKIAEENFSGGLKNGLCRKFYLTGELLEESEWKDSQREGKYTAFFTSGQPFLQCMYSRDKRNGRCLSYYPSGATEVESCYSNDLPEGTWKYFDLNGNLRYTLEYEHGLLKNPEVLLKLETEELDRLEKQRNQLADPEKYLMNPEAYPLRKP